MTAGAFHQRTEEERKALKAHCRRYGIQQRDLKRLATALSVLEDFDEQIGRAAGVPFGQMVTIRDGLRVLLGKKAIAPEEAA